MTTRRAQLDLEMYRSLNCLSCRSSTCQKMVDLELKVVQPRGGHKQRHSSFNVPIQVGYFTTFRSESSFELSGINKPTPSK
jgi:hypothetical protein